MNHDYFYVFPAVRGIQAGREYYISMCPMRLVPKIFLFDETELQPEIRAQRVLNKGRIPAIASYILENPKDYVFSSLTASIDSDVEFIPISSDPSSYNIGHLKIPMSARFVINDGQHRRAAIEEALKQRPEMGNETISVVFFIDLGLKRSQQMFADLNRYAVRPTKSLSILYDHRDPFSKMVKQIVSEVTVFNGLTEMEKSTISNRSTKLFTLSGIYHATKELLSNRQNLDMKEQKRLAVEFWSELARYIKEWQFVKQKKVTPSKLRKDYICAHSVALMGLGKAGQALLDEYPQEWKKRLKKIQNIDWHRNNKTVWEGRVTVGGKISNSRNNVLLLTNEIKRVLGLKLNKEEQGAESAFVSRL
ncbi:MAG: DNA sulfur modification protein DndB [Thermosipho sp. (in: Bacteria)]|nr:DNA sulfur modification protein DndB [Thermosipho sp. (in: thermotogales)]